MPFNLVIIGPPGSGKGTQSRFLAKKYNLQHISTGGLFREEVINNTATGLYAKKYIDRGILIPDIIVLRKLMPLFADEKPVKGYIFDGFPRTMTQALALDKYLIKKNETIDLVMLIDVEIGECLTRMIGRSADSGRSDDTQPVMHKRLEVYNKFTKPISCYYQDQGKLSTISGMDPVSVVADKLNRSITKYLKSANISN